MFQTNAWSAASKAVGCEERVVDYPSVEQVEHARLTRDAYSLIRWSRFLPYARDDGERRVIQAVVAAVREVRQALQEATNVGTL